MDVTLRNELIKPYKIPRKRASEDNNSSGVGNAKNGTIEKYQTSIVTAVTRKPSAPNKPSTSSPNFPKQTQVKNFAIPSPLNVNPVHKLTRERNVLQSAALKTEPGTSQPKSKTDCIKSENKNVKTNVPQKSWNNSK